MNKALKLFFRVSMKMIVSSKQTKKCQHQKEQMFCSINMQTDMMLKTDVSCQTFFFYYVFSFFAF